MGNELNGILEKVLNMPQQQRAFLARQLIYINVACTPNREC
jgi:hypothetical protein